MLLLYFCELESTSVYSRPCSISTYRESVTKKCIHILLPQNDLAPVIIVSLVLVCINLLPLGHIQKIMMFSAFLLVQWTSEIF